MGVSEVLPALCAVAPHQRMHRERRTENCWAGAHAVSSICALRACAEAQGRAALLQALRWVSARWASGCRLHPVPQ